MSYVVIFLLGLAQGYMAARLTQRRVKSIEWTDAVGRHRVSFDALGRPSDFQHSLDLDEIHRLASYEYN